jgi:hypothetical protein
MMLKAIEILDVRRGGPVEHARVRRDTMLALRQACLSLVPAPLRAVVRPLDRMSRTWLKRSRSPYVDEIEAIAEIAGRPGVFFVNASYEWMCTTGIDERPAPSLRRTLDWAFPGLGRHVEIAVQDGGAGPYTNVTWPGSAGVLTAVAPGRFGAAINQAPMRRLGDALVLLPLDFVLVGIDTWTCRDRWPVAHLLRHVFDTCETFEAAVDVLARAPLVKPALISIVGSHSGQAALIERTVDGAFVHRGPRTVANEWHPQGPQRDGIWVSRGSFIRGCDESEARRVMLETHSSTQPFDWLQPPVLNGLTRLAVELSPMSGQLKVIGFEPSSRRMNEPALPATEMLELRIERNGKVRREHRPQGADREPASSADTDIRIQ